MNFPSTAVSKVIQLSCHSLTQSRLHNTLLFLWLKATCAYILYFIYILYIKNCRCLDFHDENTDVLNRSVKVGE